jgi:hypothetical protein
MRQVNYLPIHRHDFRWLSVCHGFNSIVQYEAVIEMPVEQMMLERSAVILYRRF